MGQIFCQPLKTAATGPPESVDGLVGVSDDKQAPAALGPLPGKGVLGIVDVLKLIDQKIAEVLTPGGVHLQSLRQQVIKIQNAQRRQIGAVGLVGLFIQPGLPQRKPIFDL